MQLIDWKDISARSNHMVLPLPLAALQLVASRGRQYRREEMSSTCSGRILSIMVAVSMGLSLPAFASQGLPYAPGSLQRQVYDGITNDLLTGGLGATALMGATPALSDPANVEELRTLAIYNNYRALVDMSQNGGYGVLYGPQVATPNYQPQNDGRIAGSEYLAYSPRGADRRRVTMMVQIPDSFSAGNACIITGPSSGSRNVYGAIATSGEAGLKRGCAVAYTDKGTGMGVYDLADGSVNRLRGDRVEAEEASGEANFRPFLSDATRARYDARYPHRLAFKHAHSQLNPEADWGNDVLDSVRFAFYAINQELGLRGYKGHEVRPGNTFVVASSVSNGGGASLRAAELDRHGLLDAVVVSEPNVNPSRGPRFGIVQGDSEPYYDHSQPLLAYTTLIHLYQGCANLAAENLGAVFNLAPSETRCQSLKAKGLLRSEDPADWPAEAQARINAGGVLPEQNFLQPSHYAFYVPQSIAYTYASSYGFFPATRSLCGFSFAAVDAGGVPAALAETSLQLLFGSANGIPPTAGVSLINDLSPGGPPETRSSISPTSGVADQNLDGALCLRALWQGRDPLHGQRLRGIDWADYLRVRWGSRQVLASGRLGGKPTLIVTGRADAILAPNHTSRPYYALSRLRDGADSEIRYYEVTNAHHLDAFNAFAGFDSRYLPLHHYFIQALDLLFDHLQTGTPLPPSQVVHTTPRGADVSGVAVPIEERVNLPTISASPGPLAITLQRGLLRIPE
jgi:hydroxybutyrate-dimer hydrolase